MKQVTVSPEEMIYTLVNFGVDTLVLNVRYADEQGKPKRGTDALLPEPLIVCLNAWQALAREQEKPVATPFLFEGAYLHILEHGAGKGQWRWVLTCPSFHLTISRGKLNGVIAQVRFLAPYLWSFEDAHHLQDIWTPFVAVEDFLLTLFGSESGHLHLQVSRLDLCADLAGWDVSVCGWETSFVARSRTRVDRGQGMTEIAGGPPEVVYMGRRLATLTFGTHGSPLSCCIYDKSKEIRKSLKKWFEDIWKQHGWDGSGSVWRVELRFRREALHEVKWGDDFHGIESMLDLDEPGRFAMLWAYGVGHTQGGKDGLPDGWVRYVEPSETETNVSRWQVHPAWAVVQSAFSQETETAVNINTGEVFELPASSLAVLIRQRHYEANVKRLAQQVGGCASTLGAWLGGSVEGLQQVFRYLVEHLPEYALPDLAKVAPRVVLQEEYARQFAETIAAKRAVYGIPTSAESEASHGR